LSTVVSGALNRDKDGGKINSALRMLQFQQAFFGCFSIIYGLVWFLLAAQVIPFNMWVFMFILSQETSCAFLLAVRFTNNPRKNNTSTMNNNNTSTAMNNNQQIVIQQEGQPGQAQQQPTSNSMDNQTSDTT
jgi:hypothetical protein